MDEDDVRQAGSLGEERLLEGLQAQGDLARGLGARVGWGLWGVWGWRRGAGEPRDEELPPLPPDAGAGEDSGGEVWKWWWWWGWLLAPPAPRPGAGCFLQEPCAGGGQGEGGEGWWGSRCVCVCV